MAVFNKENKFITTIPKSKAHKPFKFVKNYSKDEIWYRTGCVFLKNKLTNEFYI